MMASTDTEPLPSPPGGDFFLTGKDRTKSGTFFLHSCSNLK